jgi:hypothetical protein
LAASAGFVGAAAAAAGVLVGAAAAAFGASVGFGASVAAGFDGAVVGAAGSACPQAATSTVTAAPPRNSNRLLVSRLDIPCRSFLWRA